jgi:hypothetical protein
MPAAHHGAPKCSIFDDFKTRNSCASADPVFRFLLHLLQAAGEGASAIRLLKFRPSHPIVQHGSAPDVARSQPHRDGALSYLG